MWKKIWAVIIALALSLLFISRCIYNIVAVVHDSGWKVTADWSLPSDQVYQFPYMVMLVQVSKTGRQIMNLTPNMVISPTLLH